MRGKNLILLALLLCLPAFAAGQEKPTTIPPRILLSSDQQRDVEFVVFFLSECAKRDLCPALYNAVVNTPSKNIYFKQSRAERTILRQPWGAQGGQSAWTNFLAGQGLPMPAKINPQDNVAILFLDNVSDDNPPLYIDTSLTPANESQPTVIICFDRKFYQYPVTEQGQRVGSDVFRGKDLLYFWKEEWPKPLDRKEARGLTAAKEALVLELIWRLATAALVSKQLELLRGGESGKPLWRKIDYCTDKFPKELTKRAENAVTLTGNPDDRAVQAKIKAELPLMLQAALNDLAEKNPEVAAQISDCASALMDYTRQMAKAHYDASKKLKKDSFGHAQLVLKGLETWLLKNSEDDAVKLYVRQMMPTFYPPEENPVYELYDKYYWSKE